MLVIDGGFRPDGTFVSWRAADTARVTEAFRRAGLRLFVRFALFDEDQAAGMLTWPHSGFHGHTAVWVPEDDRAFATRLARYCARNPVALARLTYGWTATAVTFRSDKSDGPTAGTETADPVEFLAWVLVHIPDKGQVTTRYYGWHANRPRGIRAKATTVAADGPPAIVPASRFAPTEDRRRRAALLQQLLDEDPRAWRSWHGARRVAACITQTSVINQSLANLRTRAAREAHRARPTPGRRRPADGCHPPGTATRTTRQAPERDGSHAAARHAALARSVILAYPRRSVGPRRLKFLSQILDVGERKLNVHWAFTDLSLARNPPARPLRH